MRYFIILLCIFISIDFLAAQENIYTLDITENCVVNLISFDVVQEVPVYPGCTGEDNDILKECFSNSISSFIIKNFKFSSTENFGNESVRIFVRFVITKEGCITDIKARTLYKSLEKKFIQLIEKLPQMIPGKQKGKNVNVAYTFPIIFDLK